MSNKKDKHYLTKIPRNNTDFTSRIFEFYKSLSWADNWNFLKYYQNTIRAYCDHVDSGANGLLAYLGMGMGKSILAASIAVDFLTGGNRRNDMENSHTGFFGPDIKGHRRANKCIFILTKSLAENMKEAIRKYFALKKAAGIEDTFNNAEDIEKFIEDKFYFVSMNASNMITQFIKAAAGKGITGVLTKDEAVPGSILLKDTLVIVDEAHNLFRGITNGSKNGLGFYKTMEASINSPGHNNFMLFLTGTPINNNPFELVPCFNLLAGSQVFPIDYQDFKDAFVNSDGPNTRSMKNVTHFMDRILGLVAYVTHESTPGKALKEDGDYVSTGIEFPEDLGISVVLCPMAPEQYSLYLLARDLEMAENSEIGRKGPMITKKLQLPKSSMTSSYRTKSRQLSNFYEGNLENKDPAAIKNSWTPKYEQLLTKVNEYNSVIGTLGLVYSQYVGIGGLGSLAEYLKSQGWKEYSLEYIAPESEEMAAAVEVPIDYEEAEVIEEMTMHKEKKGGNEGRSVMSIHKIFEGLGENDSFNVLKKKDPYEYIPGATKPYKSKRKKRKGGSEVGTQIVQESELIGRLQEMNRRIAFELMNLPENERQELLSAFNKLVSCMIDIYTVYRLLSGQKEKVNGTGPFVDMINERLTKTVSLNLVPTIDIWEERVSALKKYIPAALKSHCSEMLLALVSGAGANTISGGDEESNNDYEFIITGGNENVIDSMSDHYDSSEEEVDYSFVVGGSKFYNEDANKVPIKAAKTFAIIKGGLTAESRKRIESVMTSPDNRHGEIVSLVLVSSVGAEGLDFKAIRHIHILEPYWNYARIAQIQFRGIRNDSHKSLPPDEKNVKTFIYCAIPPKDISYPPRTISLEEFESARFSDANSADFQETKKKKGDKSLTIPDTTDTNLLIEAIKGFRIIESFLDPIQRASLTAAIDAMPNARLCAPTGERLYTDNLSMDLKLPDTCREYVKKRVNAKEIVYAGKTYYYAADPNELMGFKIFYSDKKPMKQNAPEYTALIDLIESAEGLSIF